MRLQTLRRHWVFGLETWRAHPSRAVFFHQLRTHHTFLCNDNLDIVVALRYGKKDFFLGFNSDGFCDVPYGTVCTTSSTFSPKLWPMWPTTWTTRRTQTNWPCSIKHTARRLWMCCMFTLLHWFNDLAVFFIPSNPWTCALLFDFSSSLFPSTSCSTSPSSFSCFSPWRTGTPWITYPLCHSANGNILSLDNCRPDTHPPPGLTRKSLSEFTGKALSYSSSRDDHVRAPCDQGQHFMNFLSPKRMSERHSLWRALPKSWSMAQCAMRS